MTSAVNPRLGQGPSMGNQYQSSQLIHMMTAVEASAGIWISHPLR